MSGTVTIDIAGAQMGGAARYAAELHSYLARTGRQDVRVIGTERHVDAAWLIRRELVRRSTTRHVAINNVSFVSPFSERWTLLANALHFLSDTELSQLAPSLRISTSRKAAIVRLTARRADVLVTPCTAMAERVTRILPHTTNRVVVRPHPVSAESFPRIQREPIILCPILFAPYKHMTERLTELLTALEHVELPCRVQVTAHESEVPRRLSANPRLQLVGHLSHNEMRKLWVRSKAIYYPTRLESFGYPLAEARANGQPVIAQESTQNREIAGAALCGFLPGDVASLHSAVLRALTTDIRPDPSPFDPNSYFTWMLGSTR